MTPSTFDMAQLLAQHHGRPQMSDRYERLFQERIQNRDRAGLYLATDGEVPVVRIYDIIGWPFIEAQDVADQLDQIDAPEIQVQINSPGGSAFEGIAIFNSLRAHPAQIHTRVDGLAASAASIVAQAGNTRTMLTGSEMMIHEAWGITIGPEQDHLDAAAALNKLSRNMADLYAERASGDPETFYDAMKAETWYTATEAVDAGLADEAVTPQTPPQDQAPQRFVDQLEAAIAAVEQVTTETESVVTFRSEQGKTPLSDDAVALVDRAKKALSQLTTVAEATASRRDELLARVADARAELESKFDQLEKYR